VLFIFFSPLFFFFTLLLPSSPFPHHPSSRRSSSSFFPHTIPCLTRRAYPACLPACLLALTTLSLSLLPPPTYSPSLPHFVSTRYLGHNHTLFSLPLTSTRLVRVVSRLKKAHTHSTSPPDLPPPCPPTLSMPSALPAHPLPSTTTARVLLHPLAPPSLYPPPTSLRSTTLPPTAPTPTRPMSTIRSALPPC